MALINCPECGKQVSKTVKICPGCGYKIKKSNPILMAIGIIFLISILSSIFGGRSDTSTTNGGMKLLEANWCYSEYGTKSICGIILNNTASQKSYVHVTINLYDASGIQIGSTLANVNNVEPGSKWKFKAPVLYENATSYKIKDITAF